MRLVNVPTKNEQLYGEYVPVAREIKLVNGSTYGIVACFAAHDPDVIASNIARFGEAMRNAGYEQALSDVRKFLGIK